MRAELETVTAWQRHHTEMNAYMEDQASFMRTLDVFSTALTAVGSVVDPSMASIYQETNKSNALSTAQTENAQAQAAVHQQGVSKRQEALRQLLVIKGCN
ncbi:MAG TPA: hypothetical protein VGE55_03515 [Limnobacter sp.]|uniref:hypothetical protein n=1 Tax=Limnobacter sp. TaxID=2003368 RepID=UPI002ED90432